MREVVPRACDLIASIDRPDAPAVGVWSAVETAVHLSQIAEADAGALTGEMDPAVEEAMGGGPAHISELDRFTQEWVDREPERDPVVIAERLAGRADRVAAAIETDGADRSVRWLADALIPASAVGYHVVEECLVHGRDIARSQGRRWTIERDVCRDTVAGFVRPVLLAFPPGALVDPEAARGLTATVAVHLRGAGDDVVFVFDDGRLAIRDEWDGPVDVHLASRPREFLLLQLGRIGPLRAAVSGRVVVWGRRPWKLLAFMQAVQGP